LRVVPQHRHRNVVCLTETDNHPGCSQAGSTALLLLRFLRRARSNWQLQHSRLLALTETGEQHNLPVGQLQYLFKETNLARTNGAPAEPLEAQRKATDDPSGDVRRSARGCRNPCIAVNRGSLMRLISAQKRPDRSRARHGRRLRRLVTEGTPAAGAAPRSSPASPARRSPAKCEALDAVPCRCARTIAGGALGRDALDAATGASGASIKACDRS